MSKSLLLSAKTFICAWGLVFSLAVLSLAQVRQAGPSATRAAWMPSFAPASNTQLLGIQNALRNTDLLRAQQIFPGLRVLLSLDPKSEFDLAVAGALTARLPKDFNPLSSKVKDAGIKQIADAALAARPAVEEAVQDRARKAISEVAGNRAQPKALAQTASELGKFALFGGSPISENIQELATLARVAQADRTMAQARQLAEALAATRAEMPLAKVLDRAGRSFEDTYIPNSAQNQVDFRVFMHPDPEIRMVAYRRALDETHKGLRKYQEIHPARKFQIPDPKQVDAAEALKEYLSVQEGALAQGSSARQSEFDLFEKKHNPAGYKDGNLGYIKSLALSLPYGCLQAARALQQLVKKVMPIKVFGGGGYLYIGYPALFNSYFSDGDIPKIMVSAAKTIMDRVERLERGDVIPTSDLLTDLRGAARKALGKNAETSVWKILGIYGIRGPDMSLFWDLGLDENQTALLAASQIVFASLTHLDSLQMKASGKSYSMPEHIKSPAVWPKPYHFWLPAFLVKEMIEEGGFAARAAALAVHLSHLGYEFASQTAGRDPATALVSGTSSNYNNIIRSDLLLAAAGNRFGVAMAKGAKAEQNPTLDLAQLWDQYYARIHGESGAPTKEMYYRAYAWLEGNIFERLAAYLWWRSIIKPDVPRRLIAKQA